MLADDGKRGEARWTFYTTSQYINTREGFGEGIQSDFPLLEASG